MSQTPFYIVISEDAIFSYSGEITQAMQQCSDDGICTIIRASDCHCLDEGGTWTHLDAMPKQFFEDDTHA